MKQKSLAAHKMQIFGNEFRLRDSDKMITEKLAISPAGSYFIRTHPPTIHKFHQSRGWKETPSSVSQDASRAKVYN